METLLSFKTLRKVMRLDGILSYAREILHSDPLGSRFSSGALIPEMPTE